MVKCYKNDTIFDIPFEIKTKAIATMRIRD